VGVNPQNTHGESADEQLEKFSKVEVHEIFVIFIIVYQDFSYIYQIPPEIKILKTTNLVVF
jgi:hypothetical protein